MLPAFAFLDIERKRERLPVEQVAKMRLHRVEHLGEEGLFERANAMAPKWEQALHSLKGLPHVTDIRNLGLVGAVELETIPGQPGKRGFDAFLKAYDAGILIRVTGDIIAMSPPLIISEAQIDELVGKLAEVLKAVE